MAVGGVGGARWVGNHGVTSSGTAASPCSLNSAAPIGRCRVVALWLNSTSVTFGATPAGWTKLFDAAVGSHRCGLFFTAQQNINSTAAVVFGLSAAAILSANGNAWEGIDAANPLLATPVTASGTGTSMSVPTIAAPEGGLGLWFWAARYTSGGSTSAITLPADLNPHGTVTTTSAAGFVARCGAWTGGGGPPAPSLRSQGPTGAKVATATATPAAWSALAVVLRTADTPALAAA